MKPSVCFVAPKGYAALSAEPDVRHIGGAEVQQALIARGLADRGFRIRFVTLDVGQGDDCVTDGIWVYRSYRADAGLPVVRFLHPRATRIWRAMGRADADVYYQRTSDSLTGIVAAFCRWKGRVFVFGVGALGDCQPDLPYCPTRRERLLYRYGLTSADAVVAQTATQQRLLRSHFRVNSAVISSCCREPADRSGPAGDDRPRALWIGRLATEKRMNMLLDVAERCPDVAFDVIGDGPDRPDVAAFKTRASSLVNVALRGYVPYAEMPQVYERGTVLINTSVSEGFPNTFLEAWSRGIPVATTFDPDGIVATNQLGFHADTVDDLGRAVRTLCFDRDVRTRFVVNARDYFRSHHTIEAAATAYDRLFTNLADRPREILAHAGRDVTGEPI